ncbi:uncharacterized protein [Macrobrachium rosenbergii]|uniref:uncharacterized protein n=1 Tax=Macrobrachium rosenbergii TaxID=79674 RepID=UPI0034D658CC
MATEELIGEVFRRRALWDPSDPLHKNNIVLKKHWEDISNQLLIDEISAKRKWKNLKDYYRKEIKKLENPRSGDGASEMVHSTWPYFTQLSFLKDIYRPASRSSNLSQGENTQVTEDDQSVAGDDTESDASHVSQSFMSHTSRPPSPSLSLDNGSTSQDISWQTKPSSSNKRRRPNLDYVARKNEQLIEIEKQKLEFLRKDQEESDNEDLLFFKSLLPYMKKLNTTKKLRIRSQIQNLFLKEMEEAEQNEWPSNVTIGAMQSTPNPYINVHEPTILHSQISPVQPP